MWSVGYGAQYPHFASRRRFEPHNDSQASLGEDAEPYGDESWLRRLYKYPRLASNLQGSFASAMRQAALDHRVAIVAGMMRQHEHCG